jgi:hypothetical protein
LITLTPLSWASTQPPKQSIQLWRQRRFDLDFLARPWMGKTEPSRVKEMPV